jgi:site-specific DNA-methyltransferase (adenine-specific)
MGAKMSSEYRVVDALEGLESLEGGTVDLIVTDPAYNTLEKWRSQGTTTRLTHSKASSNDWFPVVDMDYLGQCIRECYRVLKMNSYLFVMCDYFTSLEMHPHAVGAGFEVKKPLVWEKVGKLMPVTCPRCKGQVAEVQGRGSPGMGYPFRSCYEMVFFCQKGRRKPPKDKGVRDVLRFQRLKGGDFWPTQKPVPMVEVLIRQSSSKGDLVLDPFAGSGSTLVAADLLERDALGFDIDPEAKKFFLEKASQENVRTVPEHQSRSRKDKGKKRGTIRKLFQISRTERPKKG